MPDIMLLPRIASVLEITLDDLFAEQTDKHLQTESHVFNMNAVRSFPKDAQIMIIDTMCRQTNLINCNSWDFLKVDKNASTKKIDHVKKNTTLCCLSDTVGSAFVSDNLTVIDSSTVPVDIGSLFESPEIACGIKKCQIQMLEKYFPISAMNIFIVLHRLIAQAQNILWQLLDPKRYLVKLDSQKMS